MPAPLAPVALRESDLDAFLKEHPRVVLDLWAEWCAPCKRLDPILHELAGEYGGAVAFAKVDTDAEPGVMRRYDVLGLPTLVVLKEGRRVDQVAGVVPKGSLKARLSAALGVQ